MPWSINTSAFSFNTYFWSTLRLYRAWVSIYWSERAYVGVSNRDELRIYSNEDCHSLHLVHEQEVLDSPAVT